MAIGKERPSNSCRHDPVDICTRTSRIGNDLHIERYCEHCGEVLASVDCKDWDWGKTIRSLMVDKNGDEIRILPKE